MATATTDSTTRNSWTWGACMSYARRNYSTDPNRAGHFAAWAHDSDNWQDHETVDAAFDRYILQFGGRS